MNPTKRSGYVMKKQNMWMIVSFFLLSVFLNPETIIKGIPLSRVFLIAAGGDIFVDNDLNSIACYSADGKFKFKFGQAGEGPGDIKRMGWFAINPVDHNIYVTEFLEGNKWISVFSAEGKNISTPKMNLNWDECHGLSFIQFDSQGNMYVQSHKSIYRPYKDFSIGKCVNRLLKLSPGGQSIKDIYKMEQDLSADKGGKGNITIPFFNYLYWTLYEDRLIVRESINDYFSLFDQEGNLIKKYPMPFKREKVTGKDIDDWEAWMKTTPLVKQGTAEGWFDLKYWRKRLPFPGYKPVCGGKIHADSSGNIYNMSYESKGNDKWARINLRDGKTSIIDFKENYFLITIRNGYFYFKHAISEDEYVIVKMPEKEANEKIISVIK